jgi:chromosome partitioning protein
MSSTRVIVVANEKGGSGKSTVAMHIAVALIKSGGGLQQLSRWLDFRCIEGLAERVIFRELYPRGLTAVDDVDEVTLGMRPTMSHVTARMEMQNLLGAILLGELRSSAATIGHNRAMG